MKCVQCGSDLILDDKHINFSGNEDYYFYCPKCDCSCTLEIRFNKPFRVHYHFDLFPLKDFSVDVKFKKLT